MRHVALRGMYTPQSYNDDTYLPESYPVLYLLRRGRAGRALGPPDRSDAVQQGTAH